MHWFDIYIKVFKEDCMASGFGSNGCNSYCQWCDEFLEFIEDTVGMHDDISPYDYPDIRQYQQACAAARELQAMPKAEPRKEHWFDAYIKDYQAFCHECGFETDDCENDCRWCDEFRDYLRDDISAHENIWPYDFTSQESYTEACSFANEADDTIADEEVRWWSGDPGYVQGISSPAVDPRDFASREEYEDALYRHLFEEAVSRHAVIPNTDFWLHTYVKFLKDAESVFCADKSILALLDELNYCEDGTYVHLIVPPTDELEREIRYSSWKKPRIEPQRSRYYSSWYYRPYYSRHKTITRYRKKYTEEQFRNDLFHHYPELLTLVNTVVHHRSVDRSCKLSQMEEYMEEYLPDVLIAAFYMHDMFGFSVEECVQNGLEGLLRGLKNGLWDQNTPRWMWNFDKEARREQYVLWEMRLHMIQYSLELADYLGFTMNRKVSKIIEAVMFERKDLHELSVDDFSISYEDWEVSKFCAEQIRRFFNEKNPIGLVPTQDLSEESLDCDAAMCRTCAIDLLRNMVQQLPDRERNCLVLRYGLESGTPMTLEEIGDELWISKERVRQIERKAIELLKRLPSYADLCELTENPVPQGAKYLLASSERQTSAPVREFFRYTLRPDRHDILNQTLADDPMRTRISRICRRYPHFYRALEETDVIYVDQLLLLDKKQLIAIPGISDITWRDAILYLQEQGVVASEAMLQMIRRYRHPTNKSIWECNFDSDIQVSLLCERIFKIDDLQTMSTSELRSLYYIKAGDWIKIDKALRTKGITPSEAIMELAGTTYD